MYETYVIELVYLHLQIDFVPVYPQVARLVQVRVAQIPYIWL